jgi:hypothetical protein
MRILPRISGLALLAASFLPVHPVPVPAQDWPPPLGYSRMIYDSSSDALLLYGGQSNAGQSTRDTWAYSFMTNSWTDLQPAASPSIGEGPMAFDSRRGRTVLVVLMDYYARKALSETWSFRMKENAWRQLSGATSPTRGMIGARMVYDGKADKMILFGGMHISGRMYNDTWVFDCGQDQWKKMSPKASPRGRNFHQMVYDAASDRVLLWGGEADNRIWQYDVEADIWVEMKTKGAPVQIVYGGMSYCPGVDKTLLFGGGEAFVEKPKNDTVLFDFSTARWDKINPSHLPSPRAWHAMAANDRDGRVYAFGGGADREHFTRELWAFDPPGGSWTMIGPAE